MNPSAYLIEIFLQQQWQAAGMIEVPDANAGMSGKLSFMYHLPYANQHWGRADAASVTGRLPVELDFHAFERWPAWLVDILPQGFNRRELCDVLGFNADAPSADWPLLLQGAGNPVGNMRIAEAHVALSERRIPVRGFTWDQVSQRDESFVEYLAQARLYLAGSSGVQGEWPKILLTEAEDELLYLDHALDDARARKHWIAKFPMVGKGPEFARILHAEYCYYVALRHLGLNARDANDIRYRDGVLFVRRFDRRVTLQGVERIAQESLYGLAGTEGSSPNLTHNEACRTILACSGAPQQDLIAYVLRDIANVVLGNTDNHGRNCAFQRFEDGRVRLAPVFDVAPMYLHPDMIARRMRWERDDNGSPDWASVVAQICPDDDDVATALWRAMSDFGERLEGLPEVLSRAGVEPAIVDHLELKIRSHRLRLAGLGSAVRPGRG